MGSVNRGEEDGVMVEAKRVVLSVGDLVSCSSFNGSPSPVFALLFLLVGCDDVAGFPLLLLPTGTWT